jgi:uncharacterized protein
MRMFAEQYGPWALIAGGSEGVGASFARKLAAQGLNLVLLARKPEPLEEVARQIRADHPVQVRAVPMDLTAPDVLHQIRAATDDIAVGLLIYNAGAESQMVNFLDRSLDGVSAPIRLNVIGTTTLCHHFGTLMRERGRGGIILVGSMAGFAGSALVATYAGSKAFLQVFAESLWFELRPHGIQVLGLILGTTKTPAMERVGLVFDEAVHRPMESDDAAQEGLDHLADGPTWIAGKQNRKFGDILRTSDRRQMVEMMSNVAMTVAPKPRGKSQ